MRLLASKGTSSGDGNVRILSFDGMIELSLDIMEDDSLSGSLRNE